MRADLTAYDLKTPASLGEALALVGQGYVPLAGGTDLMVQLSSGALRATRLVNLWPLGELRGVAASAEAVTIGALSTYTDLQRDAVLQAEFPMLCQAAGQTGGWAIQNRGTLGGNLANASPAADSPPALLAYGAEVELTGPGGARWLDYAAFHTGYKQTDLRPGEIITRVRLPRLPAGVRRVSLYRKVGPRLAQAISKVCLGALADYTVDAAGRPALQAVRLALGGVAPTVARCPRAAQALRDQAAAGLLALDPAPVVAVLAQDIAPIDDVRSNRRYRLRVAQNLVAAFVVALREAAGGAGAA